MNRDFFKRLIPIDSKTPKLYDDFRKPESSFHRDKYEKIFEYIEKSSGLKWLEIGCGTGVYTKFLKKDFDAIYASDIDPEMIKISKNECV
jgi:ubiquinone/menaquinone biosynthesis C-methylase UbiE